jgi:hypothetical protein
MCFSQRENASPDVVVGFWAMRTFGDAMPCGTAHPTAEIQSIANRGWAICPIPVLFWRTKIGYSTEIRAGSVVDRSFVARIASTWIGACEKSVQVF